MLVETKIHTLTTYSKIQMIALKGDGRLAVGMLFAFLLIACRQHPHASTEVLALDPDHAMENTPLSEFATEIRYVALENEPESMLVNVREIIIRQNYIYTVDRVLKMDNEINDEFTNADLVVVDMQSMKPGLFFEKRIQTEGSYYTANSESFSTNDKGELFFSRMFDNRFYHLSEGGVSSFLTVDFGEKGVDPSWGLKSTREQMDFLYSNEEGRGLASFPVLNFSNEKLLAITYNYKDRGGHTHVHQFLKFNSNATVFHTRNLINDLTAFPETLYICSYSNGISHPVYFNGDLVEVVSPAYAMKEMQVDVPGLGTVGREDNPVLVFIKPKMPLRSGW